MAREGLVVDSQTLWDQIDRLAKVLGSVNFVLAKRPCGASGHRCRIRSPRRPNPRPRLWQTLGLMDGLAAFR